MKKFNPLKIKEFREQLGMSQDSLALKMSTPEDRIWVQQISGWERGEGGLSVKSLLLLSETLGRSTDDFFEE